LDGKVSREMASNTDDKMTMISVLDSLLDDKAGDDDIYTVSNLQTMIYGIFELQGTKHASDKLVTKILLWIDQDGQEEKISQDLKLFWHGYLMKYVGESVSKKKKRCTLLREPEIMNVMQKILLAHVVSPDKGALRAMAWQTIVQVIQSYGWRWSEKSISKVAYICTWCRLACGEYRIQLEEELNLLSQSNRTLILDGCGKLMLSVVRYLVDFDERPDKTIPLDTESIFHLRQSLEETLYTTSEYLNTFKGDSCKQSTIVLDLWSQLFSETYLPTSDKSVITCFKKLLIESDDVSLMRALAHYLTTVNLKDSECDEADVEHGLIDSIIAFTERSWQTIATPRWLSQCDQFEEMFWVCGATEIMSDNYPDRIYKITNSMQQAIRILVESLPSQRNKEVISYLRLLVESHMAIIDQCQNTNLVFNDTLSRAIEALKED